MMNRNWVPKDCVFVTCMRRDNFCNYNMFNHQPNLCLTARYVGKLNGICIFDRIYDWESSHSHYYLNSSKNESKLNGIFKGDKTSIYVCKIIKSDDPLFYIQRTCPEALHCGKELLSNGKVLVSGELRNHLFPELTPEDDPIGCSLRIIDIIEVIN